MTAGSAVELTGTEEVLSRAAEAGLTRRELTALKRELNRASEAQLLEALGGGGNAVSSDLIGLLYSLTEVQLSELSWKLKASAGWD